MDALTNSLKHNGSAEMNEAMNLAGSNLSTVLSIPLKIVSTQIFKTRE